LSSRPALPPEGILVLSRLQPGVEGAFREEQLRFGSLEELLALCVSNSAEGVFVRVQIAGETSGRVHRLVLDFGHFGLSSE